MPTPLEIISFDGYVFADHDWYGGNPLDASRGQYSISPNIVSRAGNTSLMAPGSISPRRITVDITLGPNATLGLLEAIDELIGSLDPRNQRARTLVANRNGVTVERQARIEIPGGFSASGAVNVVQVVFVSEEPEWTAQSATTVTNTGAVSPFQTAITNAGQAVVRPRYRIGWDVQRGSFGAVVGQKYRKRMTLLNNQQRTLAPFPRAIALGNTSSLVSGSKAQSDGDDLQVILNGESITRELIGWNLAYGSHLWVVIPGMDAGETLTLDVVYGNSAATNPPEWDPPERDRPVIDMKWEVGTATAGSTSSVTNSGVTWYGLEWVGGKILMLTGPNAGITGDIVESTDHVILIDGTFSGTPVAVGNQYLLYKSTNETWIYGTQVTERGDDYARGRFYVNSASFTPSDTSFESPGSWVPALVWDNRDSFGIKSYSMLTMGGSDKDPFALLDAQRMWEGNDGHVYNAGTADGFALTTPAPIDKVYWAYDFTNPNGMCQTWIGIRESGAEDWAELYSDDDGRTGTHTYIGGADFFIDNIQTDFGNAYQIVMALGPVNGIEIELDWKRDTGSLTSATTTVSTDSSKEWATDQFDNGSILMLSGVNAGIKRGITSGTGTAQTHSAFPTASADGDRYVVQNKRLQSTLVDEDFLAIRMDTSVFTDSGLGSETAVYELSAILWVGDGPSGDPAGQHRALIGYAAGERRLFLTADEVLEIDAESRRIRIYDTVTEEYTQTLTDPMVVIQWHDGTEWKRSADWLPLGMGNQLVWLEETNMGTLSLEVEYYAAYLGA